MFKCIFSEHSTFISVDSRFTNEMHAVMMQFQLVIQIF